MKSRLRRTRKVIFWLSTWTIVLSTAAWIFSAFWGIQLTIRTSDTPVPIDDPQVPWTLYPGLTVLLIDGHMVYVDSPGESPTLFEFADSRYEWSEMSSLAQSIIDIAKDPPVSTPFKFEVVEIPLWAPIAVAGPISAVLFLLPRLSRRRAAAKNPHEWAPMKRATWKRTAISAPILIASLAVTPILMLRVLKGLFPSYLIESELRRRYNIPESVSLILFLAIWLALSYALARMAFTLTAWTRIRIFGEGHIPCAKCGYDLMGNTSGICPECGTAIEPEQKAAT